MLLSKEVVINLTGCKLKRFIAAKLRQVNVHLTPEQFMLIDLLWNQGPMSHQQLADQMQKDKNSVTKPVDAIERKGFVVTEKAEALKCGAKQSSIMRRLIYSLFLLLLSASGYAQSFCLVSGTIFSKNEDPVPYAAAVVYQEGRVAAGALADEEGHFSVKIPRSVKESTLIAEFMGYEKAEVRFIPDRSGINLGRIVLEEDAVLLGEAVVSAKVDAVKASVEHMVINSSANMTSDKGSAIDLLTASSSVTVGNETVSIRGNSNILVLVDGVPTTLTDLSALPAANIKSIEVITNPDASHDSEGTGGIINIVSKKTSVKGFSGVVSANYGFNHFATGNIAFSYVRPRTSWRFSYNTLYEDDVINTTLDRILDEGRTYQQMTAVKYVYNNNISIGADFRIDKRNTMNIDLKCILPRNNLKQDLHNTFYGYGSESHENRHNDVTWNRENIEAVLTYRHVIEPEVSDISVRGSISKIWGHRPSYYSLEGIQTAYSESGGSPFITSLQADFKHKLNVGMLTAGAKLTYRSNDIYHRFYEGGEYSDAFSNDLLHTEIIPAAYVLFSSRIGKNFTYKAGLRGEFSTVTLASSHEDLDIRNNDFFASPSLSGTLHLTDGQELSLAFSRRIGRPAYPQLNPYMSMVDATTYEQGNMHLMPEKASKLDLGYSFRTRVVQIFADAYMNYTSAYISQITKITDDLLITTYINGTSDSKTGVDLTFKLMPAKWMTATLSANTFYVDTKGYFEGADINNRGWSNNSNLLLDFLPSKSTDVQLQYFLTTPQYYPQLTTALTHYMNVGLKQKFLKGAMSVSVLLTDVFNTYKWKVESDNRIFSLTNISTRKSRMLWLGISYNFNSFKQKKAESKGDSDRSLIKLGL